MYCSCRSHRLQWYRQLLYMSELLLLTYLNTNCVMWSETVWQCAINHSIISIFTSTSASSHAGVLCRCFVEPFVMWRPEDAHHSRCPGCADQRCDHPPFGLGHVPPYTRGPQVTPPLLPGPPQRHRLPQVSFTDISISSWSPPNHLEMFC